MKDVMNQLSENEHCLTETGGVPQEVTDDMRESERYYQKRHWTIEVRHRWKWQHEARVYARSSKERMPTGKGGQFKTRSLIRFQFAKVRST